MPAEVQNYALIVREDALINSYEIDKDMAIGGTLKNIDLGHLDVSDHVKYADTLVKGHSYVNTRDVSGKWNFRGGITEGTMIKDMFDWSQFSWLARNIEGNSFGDFWVKVFDKGGSYSMDDVFDNNAAHGDSKGKALAVFNTIEDIQLTRTSDGRPFGPSVLAPMATVTLDANTGDFDGFIIARSLQNSSTYPLNANPAGLPLHLHGIGYKGPVSCKLPADAHQ